MAQLNPDPQVREALFAFQQYLSDNMAPLVAADAISVLIKQPPQLVATELRTWIAAQYRSTGAAVPISDYIFHAVKKLHVMGQFKLLPERPLAIYLDNLAQIILEYCPEEDRELLRTNLGLLNETDTSTVSSTAYVHRQVGTENPLASQSRSLAPSGEVLSEVAKSNRQLGMLLERMESEPEPGTTESGPMMSGRRRAALSSQIISLAAGSSETEEEFRRYMDQLGRFGMEAQTDQIFQTLGESLPDWVAPVSAEDASATSPSYQSDPIEAMRKIISLAADNRDGAKRLRELAHTAIEHVNTGALARAVSMLELAERIIAERQLDDTAVEGIRQAGIQILDLNQLRKHAENQAEYPLLRRILSFFPEFTPQGLLDSLQIEQKRDRRRLLLELLEVHGSAARDAVFTNLEGFLRGTVAQGNWYFPRNLVYLLRRVPIVVEDARLEVEIDAVTSLTHPGRYQVPIVREAIAYLGQRKHPRAEKALIACIRALEDMVLKSSIPLEETKQLISLLDRAVSALARCGTRNAPRAVVEHGLKREARLGDTMARLASLAGQDLSGDKEVVDRLLKALKSELPVKVLGFVVQKSSQNLKFLIEALSTTPAPEVRQAFEEMVKKFPAADFAKLATKALDGFQIGVYKGEAPSTGLSGTLEVFGLPGLLERLAESRATGVLSIKDKKGAIIGSISMQAGHFKDGQAGELRGEDAVYRLFEKPEAGTFEFVGDPAPAADAGSAVGGDIVPLIVEGMRRYDGYLRASALVSDGASFTPTETEAMPHPQEADGQLFQDLWNRVSAGATAAESEAAILKDPFRIRRLIAHWLEQGALELKPETSASAGKDD